MAHYLFFDLDGTLSDTHDLSRATWFEILRPHGIDVDYDFYHERLHGRDTPDVLAELLPEMDKAARQDLHAHQAARYRDRTRRAAPLPGVTPFLDTAREKGFKLALVTNAPEADALESLIPLGLDTAFEPRVFKDDVSKIKPDAEPYTLALSRAGIEGHDAIAFEDSPRGVQAACAAGLTAIALVTTHHPHALREAGASLVIGDFSDPILDELLDDPTTLSARG